jgi:hypothetical protein
MESKEEGERSGKKRKEVPNLRASRKAAVNMVRRADETAG